MNGFLFIFLWPHLQYMQGPRPKTESKPELWPTQQLWQHGILTHCATEGTPEWISPPFYGHQWHTEFPGQKQIRATVMTHAIAVAMLDNPLCLDEDWTCVLVLQRHHWCRCATLGTSFLLIFNELIAYMLSWFDQVNKESKKVVP